MWMMHSRFEKANVTVKECKLMMIPVLHILQFADYRIAQNKIRIPINGKQKSGKYGPTMNVKEICI